VLPGAWIRPRRRRVCEANDSMIDNARLVAVLQRAFKRVHDEGGRLTWHQKLTSVWRPHYAPFAELLEWIPDGATMLDIGCGSGAFLFLCDEFRSLNRGVGIDANPDSISLARGVLSSRNLRFRVGSELPPDVFVDVTVVTMIDVLHHVPRAAKDQFLTTTLGTLQSGCRVVIKDLDPLPRWMANANRITDYLSTRSMVDYIGRSEIERRLTASGFDVISSQDLRKHVWSHYLVVGQRR